MRRLDTVPDRIVSMLSIGVVTCLRLVRRLNDRLAGPVSRSLMHKCPRAHFPIFNCFTEAV